MRKLVAGFASLMLTALVLSAGLLIPTPASARVAVVVGVDPYWGWPAPYPYNYYYGPSPVVVAPPPVYVPAPVYVQPPPPPTPVTAAPQSWYYCDNPQGYYPTVAACPAGWRQVPAQPPH